MTGPALTPDLAAAAPAAVARPSALDALERAALSADAAEKRFRAGVAAEVETLEVARRHAFRRYAFLKALIAADASASDHESSIVDQRAAAAEELDWDEIDDARRPVLDALAPLVDAVHAARVALHGAEGAVLHLSPVGRGRPEGSGEGASTSPAMSEDPSPAMTNAMSTSPYREELSGAALGEADPILAALDAFESWHLDARGKPFENLFDRYVQETPLVDF